MVSAGMEQHARYECFHFNRPTSSRAAARTWTTVALRCTIEPPPYALGLFIRLCLFFRRARGVTTASVLQVLWALTVKSRGTGVTADRARTAASATQCWTALCVNARRSLPDSCVRWVVFHKSHSILLLWIRWRFYKPVVAFYFYSQMHFMSEKKLCVQNTNFWAP